MTIPAEEEQSKFFDHLKKLNPNLYGHLNPKQRTFFLRLTGDNFRAASKYSTEQIS